MRINSKDANVWYNLGCAYGQKRKQKEPKNLEEHFSKFVTDPRETEAFQKAVQLNPELPEAWYSLGVCIKESYKEKDGEQEKLMEIYLKLKEIDLSMAEEFYSEVVRP